MSNTHHTDLDYMRQALMLARRAGLAGEIPVGALVVSPTGAVLGEGANETEQQHCQLFHAEARAIHAACKKQQDWRLAGATLYVTLEPCMMCISLCALSRIERIVYGADSPVFGYHLDREGVLAVYTKQIKSITKGLLADESSALLKEFFTQKRKAP
jgi:tRNA(adenine34) deaminase